MRTLTPALRRALRIALPPVLAVSGLTAAATPSSAGPVAGSGLLEVFTTASGFDVCVYGDVTPMVYGQWVLTISGVRTYADGSLPWWFTVTPDPVQAPRFDYTCEPVVLWSYPYGEFQADFRYVGSEVVVQATGGGTWDPFTGKHPWSVNPTP